MTIDTRSADDILELLSRDEMPLMSDRAIVLQAFLELGLLGGPLMPSMWTGSSNHRPSLQG